MIDNEPDWSNTRLIGYLPYRKAIHRRSYMWCFTVPRYSCQDPLVTSVSHEDMNRIYKDIGYWEPPAFMVTEACSMAIVLRVRIFSSR